MLIKICHPKNELLTPHTFITNNMKYACKIYYKRQINLDNITINDNNM